MKHKLQKNAEDAQEKCRCISSNLDSVHSNLNQVETEYHRVAQLSRAPMCVLNDIDRQFEKATQLHGIDTTFLFTATALQCLRQYVLTPMTAERLNDQEAAQLVKGEHKEISRRSHRLYMPSLEEIQTNPVPFDATMGAKQYKALQDFGYLGHRGATPGHDPLFGLLFGTANIATSTLTNWRMESYHIYSGTYGNASGIHDIFSCRAQTPLVFSHTFDKLLHQGMDGKIIIGASVLKEIQHLRSDLYSKNSLPLPAVSAINPTLAGELAKRGFDAANALDIVKQFTYALAIDTLIWLIHGLYYDTSEGLTRSMYEIRTRKILIYSNLLATVSNVIVATIRQCLGANGVRVADWGGYINTVRHIAADAKFIREIKQDFLKNELYDRIVGDEYDFMKGDF